MNTPTRLEKIIFWILCALFVSSTFSSALVEITFSAALILWIYWKTRPGIQHILADWDAGLFFLAAFALFCALTWFWSEFPPQSAKGMFKVLQQFFLLWMARDFFSGTEQQKFFDRLVPILYAVLILDAGVQYLTGRDFIRGLAGEPASAGYRVGASFKSYGQFAAFLAVTLPYLLTQAWNAWRRRSFSAAWLHGFLAAGGLTCLFLTRSRGGLMAFAGGVGILFLLRAQWKWIAALALLCAGLFFALPKGMIIHLDAENREQSLVERYYLWDRALHVIRAKPLGGTGINTYAVAHQRYDKTQNWRVRNYYAHNGYLQIGAETGLPGLGLFLAGLVLLIRQAIRRVRAQSGAESSEGRARLWAVLTGVFAFLIMSLADTVMHNNQSVLLFWFWLGLLAALSRTPRTA